MTNLAVRLGACANGGAIYVGEATAQRLDDTFALGELGPHAFKNVREPVVVYEMLALPSLVEAGHRSPDCTGKLKKGPGVSTRYLLGCHSRARMVSPR